MALKRPDATPIEFCRRRLFGAANIFFFDLLLIPLKSNEKQKLNAIVESLAQGKRPRATRLDFWIYEDSAEHEDGADGADDGNQGAAATAAATVAMRRVSATLPRSSSQRQRSTAR